MGSAIDAVDLVKTYPKGVRALEGVTFSVEAGTIFGLLGPNGAGKSTTVKILTTLSRADSGRASVAGHDVAREPERVRRAIGVVGQKPGVDPDATGRENVQLQGDLYGIPRRELRSRVDELLARFGLAEAAGRLVRTYSGGMQRRLDVAMGLVNRPRVLFLDEPTTGLDPEARAEMWLEIERLAGEGVTVLLTTHYLEEADRLASRLAIVDRGRIVAEGTPEALKSELRGDALVFELADPPRNGYALEALAAVPGVREPSLDGQVLRARAQEGARAMPAAIAALEAAGLAVAAATVSRPSLDDVYLTHAGRTFDEADEEVKR
jgi:ABC-2 type transport system ATP-binding protein